MVIIMFYAQFLFYRCFLKKFKTLSQAEAAFDIDYFQPIAMEKAGFREDNTPLRTETDDTVDTSQDNSQFHKFVKRYEALSIKMQRQLLEHMFKKLVVDAGGVEFYQFVSEHFFKSSLAAMKTLFDAKKANLILKLSNCFEDPIPRLPLDKMPYGLLDYNIQFFPAQALSTYKLKIIMQHGLRQCFLILATNGFAYIMDQHGTMSGEMTRRPAMLKHLLNRIA